MNILSIGLSQAKHFENFGFSNVVYCGPRFEANRSKNEIKTSNSVTISQCLQKAESLLKIDIIIIFIDPFAFHLFKVEVDCSHIPIVALIGDTHHGSKPIQSVYSWLKNNSVDKIILKQTKHQKFIFESLGFSVLALPYYLVNPNFIEPRFKPYKRTAFVGSSSNYHSRRKLLLDKLKDTTKIDIHSVPRYLSLKYYNKYSVSLNMPLCSDTNYKIHEIISAGGCLLTEKFSLESTKYDFLVDGVDYISFDSFNDCKSKMDLLINDTKLRNKVAINGYKKMMLYHNANTLASLIVSFSKLTRRKENCNDSIDLNVVKEYECIQENFRKNPHFNIPSEFANFFSTCKL